MNHVTFTPEEIRSLMTSVSFGGDTAQELTLHYIDQHLKRFVRTLASVPPAPPGGKLLDVAGLANLVPCYQRLGYQHVTVTSADAHSPFVPPDLEEKLAGLGDVQVKYFNVEFDKFPFPDEHFDTVLCCEVLEHLTVDPMAMVAELNRVCKTGGTLLMTTPNIVSWKALARVIAGRHPSGFNSYSGINSDRHNREYTPREVERLLQDAGFDVTELTTFSQSGLERGHRWMKWCIKPLERFWALPPENERGDFILVSGKKAGPIRNRLPDWLYGQFAEDRTLLARKGLYAGPLSGNGGACLSGSD